MLVGMNFLYLLAIVMNMCSPPSVGSTFSKNDFCKYRVQEDVSIPKRHHFWRGVSALCCAKNNIFCRLSGKWPTLEALFNITSAFASILKQIFLSSVLLLPLFLVFFQKCGCRLRWEAHFCKTIVSKVPSKM